MSTVHQTQSGQTQALKKVDPEKQIEFIPFGAEQAIRLSVNIVKNNLAKKTKSGLSCSDSDAIKFMMMCQARGLNPWEGDAFLVGYDERTEHGVQANFSLITAHNAFLKRAEISPNFDGMESGVVLFDKESGTLTERETDFHLPDETVVGGWAKVWLKNRRFPTYRRIRMARFNKGFGQWKDDPAGMIVKCAEADALRSSFPTKVGGLYMADEMPFPVNSARDAVVVSSTPAPLVAVSDAPAESETQPAAEEKQQQAASPTRQREVVPAKPSNFKKELEDLLAAEKITFGVLQRWGIESGNIDGADSMAGFDDIGEDVAKRLLRNKVGMIKALKSISEDNVQ